MRTASQDIVRARADRQACTNAEKFGCAISFLRCAERGDVVGRLRNASRYSHINPLVDSTDAFLREKISLEAIRNHVVELAGQDVADRIEELHTMDRTLHSRDYTCRKEQLLVRLKKLLPGSPTGLNALENIALACSLFLAFQQVAIFKTRLYERRRHTNIPPHNLYI